MFKAVNGDNDEYGASLKIEERKKTLRNSRDFMVMDLPFSSHEEFIELTTQIRGKQNIQVALAYF